MTLFMTWYCLARMDILYSIDVKSLEQVFAWDAEASREIIEQVSRLTSRIQLSEVTTYEQAAAPDVEKMFYRVCEYLFEQTIPLKSLTFIDNPFTDWTRFRTKKSKKLKPLFKQNETGATEKFPDGTLRDMTENTIYVVKGYKYDSANSDVYQLVYYNNNACVLKVMYDDNQPSKKTKSYVHTQDMYELILHMYMEKVCQRHTFVSVPRLFQVRSKGDKTYALIERISGEFLASFRNDSDKLCTALAYVMRALFVLQHECHFMHRDLSCSNVAFDFNKREVQFIDFGYSCVNPTMRDIAWQANNDFFQPLFESRAARCDNASLDVCTLISSCVDEDSLYSSTFCSSEKISMQYAAERHINSAKGTETYNKFTGSSSTFIKVKGGSLEFGGKEPHWWNYDTIEFPMWKWYPEHVLSRLLPIIALAHWPLLRRGAEEMFDAIMPKVRVVDTMKYSNATGTLERCSNNSLFIKYDGDEDETEEAYTNHISIIKS